MKSDKKEVPVRYVPGGVYYGETLIPDDAIIEMAKNLAVLRRSKLDIIEYMELSALMSSVCAEAGVAKEDVMNSRKYTNDIVAARYVFCVIAYDKIGLTQEKISLFVYGSVHTHGNVNKALVDGRDRIRSLPEYRRIYEETMKHLQSRDR